MQNPLQLIEEYKKEHDIQTDDSIVEMLQDMFEGIEPVINKSAGGSEYKTRWFILLWKTAAWLRKKFILMMCTRIRRNMQL